MASRRLALRLEYDGTDFRGSQWQAEGRTVQGTLEKAIADLVGEPVRAVFAGRTDAGVHALGQVVHVQAPWRHPPAVVQRALNARLPGDLAVTAVLEVPEAFHARRSALWRRYRYRLYDGSTPSPLRRRYAGWHRRGRLDEGRMAAAARLLVGERDFASFAGGGQGVPWAQERTVRHLRRLEVQRRGEEVWIWAEANAFLRYMVRNLVGALVVVGRGELPPEGVLEILAARDRRQAPPPAPPQGLCLVAVGYPEPWGTVLTYRGEGADVP